jgi:hypothetical protein
LTGVGGAAVFTGFGGATFLTGAGGAAAFFTGAGGGAFFTGGGAACFTRAWWGGVPDAAVRNRGAGRGRETAA